MSLHVTIEAEVIKLGKMESGGAFALPGIEPERPWW